MMPYPGLDLELEEFFHRDSEASSCEKCAYVVPGYELSAGLSEAPKNKKELIDLVEVWRKQNDYRFRQGDW